MSNIKKESLYNNIPLASEEQLQIIDYLKNNNVIVDSVAGSGKTTTILHMAINFLKSNILLLTYNSRLKTETRNKVNFLGLKNIEVHSYHSFCYKYFSNTCRTDVEVRKFMEKNKDTKFKFRYDYIIIDEAQDMTPLYFELVHKIIDNNCCSFKICILGDIYQSIFDFNGADDRFLTYGNILLNVNKYEWKKTKLTTSYRLTDECSNFLNDCVLKEKRINVNKKGKKIRYIICDCFADGLKKKVSAPYNEIKYYLKNYDYNDIFVLAPSVKSLTSPIRVLSNKLSSKRIPVYVPSSDEEKLDEDILKGKIAFCTFHQTKGLERKVVLVYGMDDSYFRYYKKNSNANQCPNEIYVALTRSSERMSLFHHYSNNYLPFLDINKLKNQNFIIKDKLQVITNNQNKSNEPVSVTDLLRHLQEEVIYNALKYITVDKIKNVEKKIDIPIKTEQKYNKYIIYENVSEINGTAIPAYFELLTTNKMTIHGILNDQIDYSNMKDEYYESSDENKFCQYMFSDENDNLKENNEIEKKKINMEDIKLQNLSTDELLYIANEYCSFISGFIHKKNQISKYDWLSKNNLEECCDRLKKIISDKSIYEKKIIIKSEKDFMNKSIVGFIDCIDKNKVYEFKCVDELKSEHFLQLAIYKYLHDMQLLKNSDGEEDNFTLFDNIKDNIEDKNININDTVEFEYNGNSKFGIIVQVHKNGWVNVKHEDIIYKLRRIDIKKINEYKYYLFNILTNEMYEIKATIENLKKMIQYLIETKYKNNNRITDDEFIDNMRKLICKQSILNNNSLDHTISK